MKEPDAWHSDLPPFLVQEIDFGTDIGDVITILEDQSNLSIAQVTAMVAASCMDTNNEIRNPGLFRTAHTEGKRQLSGLDLHPNSWTETTIVPLDTATIPTLAYKEL